MSYNGNKVMLFITAVFGIVFSVSAQVSSATETRHVRIEAYSVNTTIETRFSRTVVSVNFVNERNCSTTYGFTFQLPLNARATNLTMNTNNGCIMESTVKEEQEAEEEFRESVAQGRPAALLTAYDTTNYGIQVSLPPLGRTDVLFTYEELLHRKSHQIPFQVPISPGLPVDRLVMDITVNEPQSGIAMFEIDETEIGLVDTDITDTTAKAHFEMIHIDAMEDLPRLIRGFYDSGPIPPEGLLVPDGTDSCFVHLFNPNTFLETTGSLPRHIVFVIDVSGSMSGQKLRDAKNAFAAIVENLTDDDYFAIHTFSNFGIEDLWGPHRANSDFKPLAVDWVQSLRTIGGTNMNDAYVDAIEQIKNMHDSSSQLNTVPVVVILSDGQATQGETSSSQIARNVRNVNEGIEAKIYALAFGFGADLPLLSGISIQNGGIAARIYEGYGDAATQMESFYIGELGAIIMSDLNVFFNGTDKIESQTQSHFSIFPDGSEIAVRVRTLLPDVNRRTERMIEAQTTANTARGTETWTTRLDWTTPRPELMINQECLQSFAHGKIAELLLFRDAASSLGDEMYDYAPSFLLKDGVQYLDPQVVQGRSSTVEWFGFGLVETAERQALKLALEAGVVWPGLTAMVTVENSVCKSMYNNADIEICYDGHGAFMEDSTEEEAEVFSPSVSASGARTSAPLVTSSSSGTSSFGQPDSVSGQFGTMFALDTNSQGASDASGTQFDKRPLAMASFSPTLSATGSRSDVTENINTVSTNSEETISGAGSASSVGVSGGQVGNPELNTNSSHGMATFLPTLAGPSFNDKDDMHQSAASSAPDDAGMVNASSSYNAGSSDDGHVNASASSDNSSAATVGHTMLAMWGCFLQILVMTTISFLTNS